jgi:hypothetical protein
VTIEMSPQAPEWLGQPSRHPCVDKAACCAVHSIPLHKIHVLTLLCQVGCTKQELNSENFLFFYSEIFRLGELHNAKLKGYIMTCKL